MLSSACLHLTLLLVKSFLTIAAPLSQGNKLQLIGRGVDHGWTCQYQGPLNIGVDASINLPSVVASLCLEVNYAHAGCNNFRPKHDCPDSRWNNTLSVCADVSPAVQVSIGAPDKDKHNSTTDSLSHPTKPKKHSSHGHDKSEDDDVTSSAQSIDHDEDDDEGRHNKHSSKSNKHQPHVHKKSDDDDPTSYAQSIDHPEDDDEEQGNPTKQHGKPEKKFDNKHCSQTEKYSSKLDKCIDQSFFATPNSDGTCKKGEIDEILHLCLDVSLFGSKQPSLSASVQVGKEPTTQPQGKKPVIQSSLCPVPSQQYSPLLSACVEANLFTEPLRGNRCQNGGQLDLIVGLCVDVSASLLLH